MVLLRVVQWSTGRVGTHTLRAILDDSGLELAGVYAHSPQKVGLDAGELCGRPATGVLATADFEELLAAGVDCVVFTARDTDTETLTRILASGIDVVCTTTFGSTALDSDYRAALNDACEKGSSSLYFTGVNPGRISSIATALTATSRRVDKVTVSESCNVGTDTNADFWFGNGFSRPLGTPGIAEFTRAAMLPFADTVARVAEAMHIELDDITHRTEYAASSDTVDMGWMRIEAGTIGALRTVWTGVKGDRDLVRSRITWRLSDNLDCDWEMTDGAYLIEIEGDPGSSTLIEWDIPDYWQKSDYATLTAQPAISSIPAVCAAAPGLLGLRDIGLPHAPAGRW